MAIPDYELSSALVGPGGLVTSKWWEPLLLPILCDHLSARPVPQRGVCTACGVCVRGCPEDAIRIVDKLAVVDDAKCIRCYCCHELCPEAAIDLRFTGRGRFAHSRGFMGTTD